MIDRQREVKTLITLLKLQRLYVIHSGEETFQLGQNVQALALSHLLEDIKPLR